MGNVIEFIKYHLRMTKFSLPSSIRIIDIVQILLIAIFVYYLMVWIKNTRAYTLLKGVLIVSVFLIIAAILRMDTILWICQQLSVVAITGVLVIFQPELRRALEHIGRGNLFSREFFGSIIDNGSEDTVREMHQAITDLAKRRVGALIVIEQRTGLGDIINTGTLIEGRISAPLIENIFEPNTPLHDGAMIIRNNEIVAAACILPLVEDIAVARELGTRHRAGLGISSVSDSITIIVSEETGVISMARDGKLVRYIDSKALRNLLESIFIHKEREFQMPSLSSFRRRKGNQK